MGTIILTLLAVATIAIFLIPYLSTYKALHTERQSIKKTPKDYGLEYEEIAFLSKENFKLKGWWIEGNTDKVIIVAHGYASNRAGWVGIDKEKKEHYLDWLGPAQALVKAGYSMLYFDMRASGESEGKLITLAKEEATDLVAAVKWQLKNKGKKKIGLLGYSLGANVALRASRTLVKMEKDKTIKQLAIIAIGPYIYTTMIRKSLQYWTSMPIIFVRLVKFYATMILGFNPSKEINPSNYINELENTPILFIQSENDEIGDVEDVKTIYNKYKGEKEIIIIPNATRFVHYNYPADNTNVLIDFYNKHLTINENN